MKQTNKKKNSSEINEYLKDSSNLSLDSAPPNITQVVKVINTLKSYMNHI